MIYIEICICAGVPQV